MDGVDVAVGRENGDVRRKYMLVYIKKYYLEHGYGPTYREIGVATGQSSTSAVRFHLDKMRDNGDISYDYGKARSIVPTAAITTMGT